MKNLFKYLSVSFLLTLIFNPKLAFSSPKKQETKREEKRKKIHQSSKLESKNDQRITKTEHQANIKKNEKTNGGTKETSKITSAKPVKENHSIIRKPSLLPPIEIDYQSSEEILSPIIKKQIKKSNPYLLWLSGIDISCEIGAPMVAAGFYMLNPKKRYEHRYKGGISFTLLKNIHLSTILGYAQLYPTLITTIGKKRQIRNESYQESSKLREFKYINNVPCQHAYTVNGLYGSLGMHYIIKGSKLDFYTGVRYVRSYFKGKVKNRKTQSLQASWGEIVFGAENKVFSHIPIYLGSLMGLKILFTKMPLKGLTFSPQRDYAYTPIPNNYIIPGYGRSVNEASFCLELYLKYKFSFSKQYIGLTKEYD